jgi:monofunctional biosynthetic peptidoglycan transglycosylase
MRVLRRDIGSRAGAVRDNTSRFGFIWSCARDGVAGAAMVLVMVVGAALLAMSAVLLIFRFVDPPGSSVMAQQRFAGVTLEHRWVPIEQVSSHVVRAVVNSEDARFCRHHGIDLVEFRAAMRRARDTGGLAVRGASTISMQVVKNLFLWQDQSYLRKGLELMITPLMELIWPKDRILEVYLNIAEWGPGIFGVEAASRHHFNRPASRVTGSQASLLAAALPNPIVRKAGRPGPKTRRRAHRIRTQVRRTRLDLSCLSAARP